MSTEIKILRKEGWELNSDDDIVNDVIKKLGERNGHCPTTLRDRYGHDQCPCSDYLTNDKCYCRLYVKQVKTNKDENKKVNTTDVPYSC